MWTHSGTEKGQSVVLSKAMGAVPAVSVIRISTKVWLGLVFGFALELIRVSLYCTGLQAVQDCVSSRQCGCYQEGMSHYTHSIILTHTFMLSQVVEAVAQLSTASSIMHVFAWDHRTAHTSPAGLVNGFRDTVLTLLTNVP